MPRLQSAGMSQTGFFARHQAVRALRHRNFRFLLAGTALVGLVAPAQFITQTFWVQSEFPERDVLYVSLMAGVRGVATLLFSLIGGAIADRFDRRRVLLLCESTSFVLNAGVAFLMLTTPFGEATIAAIAALTFFAAGNQAVDIPARTASVPAIVGMEDLSNAISLNQIANQVAIPVTIPLASILNSFFDPGQVYAGTLVAWAGIIPLIAVLDYRSRGGASRGNMLANIRDGLQYTATYGDASHALRRLQPRVRDPGHRDDRPRQPRRFVGDEGAGREPAWLRRDGGLLGRRRGVGFDVLRPTP